MAKHGKYILNCTLVLWRKPKSRICRKITKTQEARERYSRHMQRSGWQAEFNSLGLLVFCTKKHSSSSN